AARAAEAGIRRLRHHDIATYRRKLNDYLSRRGFPYAVIEPIIEEALAEHALEESLYRNGG
ncbi:MAG: RecX family transcriptional regulator, partial [Anaerolineae bacterium]|nr:RecX family transcriptional regulator [Anaerolineae bacterium]